MNFIKTLAIAAALSTLAVSAFAQGPRSTTPPGSSRAHHHHHHHHHHKHVKHHDAR